MKYYLLLLYIYNWKLYIYNVIGYNISNTKYNISNYTYNRKEKEKIENDDEKTKIENTPWNRYENRRPSLSKRENEFWKKIAKSPRHSTSE